MSKKKITEEIKEIYTWFDNNPNKKGNKELYKAFPNRRQGLLRNDKSKWQKRINEGTWPEKTVTETADIIPDSTDKAQLADADIQPKNKSKNNTSISTSIIKSGGLKKTKQSDSYQPPTTVVPENEKSKDSKSINVSTKKEQSRAEDVQEIPDIKATKKQTFKNESNNTNKDTFIDELFDKRETLMKILDDYEQKGALSLSDIKIEKPFKTASYNLMEKTISEFTGVCEKMGISQRKAIHLALNDFIRKYDLNSKPL